MALMFVSVACFIFAALGIFSLGIILLSAALLSQTGLLTVMTDLGQFPLMLISAGTLALGAGMCLCIVPVCVSAYGVLKRSMRSAVIHAKRTDDEAAAQT